MVVHELGHALDDALGEKWAAKPVSGYGRVDRFEAFAEAFTAWVGLPSYKTERDRLYRIDRDSADFFDAREDLVRSRSISPAPTDRPTSPS